MPMPAFHFYYDAKFLGRVYQLQCKPAGYCLSVTKRYQVFVDWTLNAPVLAYYEIGQAIDYSKFFDYPRPIYYYANLTCWDVVQFLENTFDSHYDLEEYCYFLEDTEETKEETPE